MPRITLRTDPYNSPTRLQRHYRTKRDQTLRALGRVSFTNGGNFAVLFVNAKGDVETYASHLFQSYLPTWFSHEVQQTARQTVLRALRDNRLPPLRDSPIDAEPFDSHMGNFPTRPSGSFDMNTDDLFEDFDTHPVPLPLAPPPGSSLLSRSTSGSSFFPAPGKAEADTLGEAIGGIGDFRALMALAPYSEEVYFGRFQRLQQRACKIIARCWIKVIEPRKQARFPYQGGEDSKPDWWPRNLAHREPDHLLKQNRCSLLLAILQSGRATVNQLEVSTAEVMALFPAEKLPILRDIYFHARIDERRIQDGTPMAPSDNYYGEEHTPLGPAHLPSARGMASVPLPPSCEGTPDLHQNFLTKSKSLDDLEVGGATSSIYPDALPGEHTSCSLPRPPVPHPRDAVYYEPQTSSDQREATEFAAGQFQADTQWPSGVSSILPTPSHVPRQHPNLTIDTNLAHQMPMLPGGHAFLSAPPLGDHLFNLNGYFPSTPLTAGAYPASTLHQSFEGLNPYPALPFFNNHFDQASGDSANLENVKIEEETHLFPPSIEDQNIVEPSHHRLHFLQAALGQVQQDASILPSGTPSGETQRKRDLQRPALSASNSSFDISLDTSGIQTPGKGSSSHSPSGLWPRNNLGDIVTPVPIRLNSAMEFNISESQLDAFDEVQSAFGFSPSQTIMNMIATGALPDTMKLEMVEGLNEHEIVELPA